MMGELWSLRGALFIDALVCVILCGDLAGVAWRRIPWPRLIWQLRILMVGGLVTLVYVLAGQAKAFDLEIPFDGYSWVGLIGTTVINIGAVWTRHRLATRETTNVGRG